MGIVYIEPCFDNSCSRDCSCNKCNPLPPLPPDELIVILARLASAEETIAANSAKITALEAIVMAPIDTIRTAFEENLGETVTVNTTFDVVEGIVTIVGIDAVEITTQTDEVFILPYTSVISIS
ncbi:hypothetical protein FIU87_07130 [Bacillus sp. THAF10]|uniref:hypothetical protein n=1 Tax=Bacillus sp. THAF10 TaxID=2587848 RepID=UPI0012683457|nr:hypothetical protein [Bacillus sp. THAF10]QFT88411.1 hypothetical protein FIU87_07130 [Bacillus sp. THAF10]